MFERMSFRTTLLPIILAFSTLIVFNMGLYTRLRAAPQPTIELLALPYSADFAHDEQTVYRSFGGDWENRDQSFVQISTNGYDLGSVIPISIPSDQPYQFETRLRFLGGTMGGGILFNVQQPTSRQNSHMARYNIDSGTVYLIYGFFNETGFEGQGSVALTIAPDDTAWHTMAVQVGNGTYTLLIDGQVITEQIPLRVQGGSVGFITSTSQVAYDDVQVSEWIGQSALVMPSELIAQPAPDTIEVQTAAPVEGIVDLATLVPLYIDQFTGSLGDLRWNPFSGTWEIQNEALVETNPNGFDFSAGSLDAFPAMQAYRVTLRHIQGVGGGLLFNMAQPNLLNGAVLVRYIDNNVITWGSYNDAGVFVGLDGRTVGESGDTAHTLAVVLDRTASTYAIVLDGAPIVSGIRYTPQGDHIGLTASQSVVAFERVEVFGAAADSQSTPVVEVTPAVSTNTIELSTITGAWVNDNGVITQSNEAAVDSIVGVGVAGQVFTVSVSILLPSGIADAGAGLVFQMRGRDDQTNGQIVRLGSGGNEVLWGRFDQTSIFQGQSGIRLNLTPNTPHRMTLTVRADTFDIDLDGTTVVNNVSLSTAWGWIGLVAFGGPVVFSDFVFTQGAS